MLMLTLTHGLCQACVYCLVADLFILNCAKLRTSTPYTEVCCVCFKQRTRKCLFLLDNQLLLILLEIEFPWESCVGFTSSEAQHRQILCRDCFLKGSCSGL